MRLLSYLPQELFMLLTIKLNDNTEGHISDLAAEVDRRKLNLSTVFTGLVPVALRNKAGKVANNFELKHKPCSIDFGKRELTVRANGQSISAADIVIDISTGKYKLMVHPSARKKGLVAEVEVSIQPVRKAKGA